MDAVALLDEITRMYGEPKATHANGVFVLVVPVMGGVAIGCGSSTGNAVWDLHCDLSLPSARHRVTGLHLQPWEVQRRLRIDQSRS